jgi:hypothetical protein
MPVFETLGRINRHVKSSLKCCQGCNDCSLSTDLAWWVSTPLAPAVLKPQHKGLGGVQSALIFAALKSPLWISEFEIISFIAFKECVYLLTKLLFRYLIFLKISAGSRVLQPLMTSCPCLKYLDLWDKDLPHLASCLTWLCVTFSCSWL